MKSPLPLGCVAGFRGGGGGALVVFGALVFGALVGLMVTPLERRARAADQPALECLAANAAALKLDNLHRLRAERTELLMCATASCPADIRRECVRRVDDVTAAIPTMMFDVRDGQGNDLSAVKVTMDAELLTDRLEGIALAVDPGAHLFTFEASGQLLVRKRFVIREGEKRRLEAIVLGSAEAAARPAPEAAPTQRAPPAPQPAASVAAVASSGPGSSSALGPKVLPLIAAGLGIAGLGVGTVFGLQAIAKRNDARKACPDLCSDQRGVNAWQDARRAGTISTVAFVVGGAGLTGALISWLIARPESDGVEGTKVGLGPGTIAVGGHW